MSQASSAGIIGQSMVSALSTATVPSSSAETLSGRVMPQMPGPSISGAATIESESVDLLAGEAGVLGLGAPDRPLGAAEEAAARERESDKAQTRQAERNAPCRET